MLLALIVSTVSTADAAGYHFLKAEALYGVRPDAPEAGVGLSLVSDALAAWVTFGDPARDGHLVRTWRLEGQSRGPVIGHVPPAFDPLVAQPRIAWLLPWTPLRVGGDADAGKDLEVDLSAHSLLNVPGFFGVDPRRAYAGPSVGLGVNGTWWDGWRGGDTAVATGKVTAEVGLGGGVTLRDTVYAQARALGHVDLFGVHQVNLGVTATTGVYLDRVGLPVGVELRGELDAGNDNAALTPGTDWAVLTSVYWKLAPEYQTRIEERVERRQAQLRREALAAGHVPTR